MNYDTLANAESIARTVEGLKGRGVEPIVLESGAEALAKIKELIPTGASVMNGSSVTLEEVGYIEYLKTGTHGWNNLKDAILAEKDPVKQSLLRKESVTSDYYLGSVHALAETGEFIIASNSGSQLPHIVFTSSNLIFVVSTKKIIPTLAEGFARLEQHVLPLEDDHMKRVYGPQSGSKISKVVIWKDEAVYLKRTVRMLLVKEKLGF